MTERHINAAGLALVKSFEGLRLNAYLCPAKVLTIGYGHTGPDVRTGQVITVDEAEDLLRHDLARFEQGVVKVGEAMTDGQFAALTSFAFNLGLGALGKSTLLRKHIAGDHVGALSQFALWVRGGGKVLPGLVKRRAAEARLYKGVA